ncbi:ral guanine nucleotide dissociation stimulator-like [Dasypus novemcinctus]|uniref:ral guanine nucleotide dissociation stimulator-like n=1 Tax=Dasypus novemcinctus TaxID=9361 RepID=UPI0039C9C291
MVNEELEDGLIYSISLQKVEVHHSPSQSQCWFQRKNNSTLTREESCTVRTVKAGNWEKLMEHLVPAFQEGDLIYINIFRTYQVFTTTEQVLDWLFHRYGHKHHGSGGHVICLEMKNTLSSLLSTRLDQYPEDFLEPTESLCIKLLVIYAQVHLPDSALEYRAMILLSQMSHPEPFEEDPKAPELQMPPVQTVVPIPPLAADTGAVPEADSTPFPLPLPATEFAPVLALEVDPDTLPAVAPTTSSAGAPAHVVEAATSQSAEQVPEPGSPMSTSDAPDPEPEASPAPPNLTTIHGSAIPTLEVELAPSTSEAHQALVLEEALVPPPQLHMEVGPMTTLQIKSASSPDGAPAARLEEGTSPSASQPGYSPSAAQALEGKACLAAPPEPLSELKSAAGQVTPPEPSCSWPETSKNLLSEEKANLLAFPPELVAEQLTQMDVEQLKKVVPYHCLGAIWSQHNKKGKEHVVPTIHAIVTQFKHVTNCITTCLRDQSMKAQDRARVVEHWIEVARECQILKKFSLFYTIFSALESHSIHHLKTWKKFSRDSLHLFQMLSEIVSNENNHSQSSELIFKEISKFATLEMKLKKAQNKEQQQEREYQKITELQQLQAGCFYDSLMPNEQFGTSFRDMEQLSKKDSYHLSCELEPKSQSAGKKVKGKHRLEGIKSWCEDCQTPDTGSSGSSNPYSSVQFQCGPDFSSGEAADSPHIHVARFSKPKLKIHLNNVPESQDGHEIKLRQSTSPSTRNSSIVTSVSRGTSSSSYSIKPRANWSSHKHHDPQPCYKWYVANYYIVHVSLDEDNSQQYKSIMVILYVSVQKAIADNKTMVVSDVRE